MISSASNLEPVNAKERSEAIAISITFVVLCFVLSAPFWYIRAQPPLSGKGLLLGFANMWCSAAAAILARLIHRRGLRGFGFTLGKARWLVLAVLLPFFGGLVMFGSAWLLHIAPLNEAKIHKIFSLPFIPFLFAGLGGFTFAALGEELGWRGLLVPELSRCMGYTKLSFVSGLIWTVWHLPLMFFGGYHGTGPLWISLVFFAIYVVASSFIHAWMRLVSGSIWVSALLHGASNYFIQLFYPTLTVRTPAGEAMLGEFGWGVPIVSVAIAVGFWSFRRRIPNFSGGRETA